MSVIKTHTITQDNVEKLLSQMMDLKDNFSDSKPKEVNFAERGAGLAANILEGTG